MLWCMTDEKACATPPEFQLRGAGVHTWHVAAKPHLCRSDHLHSTLGAQPRKSAARPGKERRCAAVGDSMAPSLPLISTICPLSALNSSFSCTTSTRVTGYAYRWSASEHLAGSTTGGSCVTIGLPDFNGQYCRKYPVAAHG